MRSIGKKNTKKTKLISALVVVILLIGIVIFYFMSGFRIATDNKHSEDIVQKNNNTSGGGVTSPKDSSKTEQVSTPPDENITPIRPIGTFVSNHRPNLSGSPAPNTITSTCTTTPGAACTIRFTNGNVIRSLPVKTTDANGNVSWDWKLQDIGLTAGNWKIVAIATIGKNVVEEPDTLDLVIGD